MGTSVRARAIAFWQQAMEDLKPAYSEFNSSPSFPHDAGIKILKAKIIRLSYMEHKLCIFWTGNHHQAGGEDAQSEDQVTRPTHHGGQGV